MKRSKLTNSVLSAPVAWLATSRALASVAQVAAANLTSSAIASSMFTAGARDLSRLTRTGPRCRSSTRSPASRAAMKRSGSDRSKMARPPSSLGPMSDAAKSFRPLVDLMTARSFANTKRAVDFTQQARDERRADAAQVEDPVRVATRGCRDHPDNIVPADHAIGHALAQAAVIKECRSAIICFGKAKQAYPLTTRINGLRKPAWCGEQ